MAINKTPEHHSTINFPVVGVGASAGGLPAFKKLVGSIPAKSGMAYVLVQHLAPAFESILPELLSRETEIPVYQITDDINLAPDTIYILPENKILTAFDGKLRLDPRETGGVNMAIDLFFNSLAEVHKGFSRGVLLSGAGFDGTQGLKTIKEYGGATIVQNPESAGFDSMPLSAIRAGAADFVLEVEEIAAQLQQIDSAYESNHAYEEHEVTLSEDDVYASIIRLLKLRTGNDFLHYKQPTIRRRIARRMLITKCPNTEAYLNLLHSNKSEQDNLFNDILIPVSYFFRDSQLFNGLTELVFPAILKKKANKESIRMWVAGCSTGEEAYSLAIALYEFLSNNNAADIKVQIFASDISSQVITKARSGAYSPLEVQNVPDATLRTYFTKIDGVYHVNKNIRDMCLFAVHNFVKDPPFAKMDLITCRNVMIYFDPFLQKKALNTFHYALRPHGVLFLGKSETAGSVPNLFETLAKNQKIYIRKNAKDKFGTLSTERNANMATEQSGNTLKKYSSEPDFYKMANDILFSHYTPAGVIINEQKEIIHFHANTEPYLFQPPGKPNFNVFKMLREGLAFELRNAIVKVKGTNDKISVQNIVVKDKDYLVNAEVIPLIANGETYYLLLFTQVFVNADEKKRGVQRKGDAERIKQLEAELEQLREDIRRVSEDQETSNEELQSANEELLSNSEELQTLNEELESSAEELQSNNEELLTVNEELMNRQEQLVTARLYAEAVIETIREPLIVLNKEMRIKSANASFYRFFKTTEADIEGKAIFDVCSGKWNIASLKEQLLRVLPEKLKLDDIEIVTSLPEGGESTMLLNIRPIANDSLGENLILMAIEDITHIRELNLTLLQSNRELEENNKELSSFSYIASHDLQEPLRKIYAFNKLILGDTNTNLSEDSKAYLDRVLVSTRRMQRLIDDLLHYSQISKVNEEELEETDVSQLIHDAATELNEIIEQKNADISIAPIPSLKVVPILIQQLFINLIGNAIKYSNANVQPKIKVTYETTSGKEIDGDSSVSYCKITVSDNGIGFMADQSVRIFEPFQRLHAKDRYEGTGVGLAICKKIMVKHKGYITAHGEPGKGAAFHLYFPLNP